MTIALYPGSFDPVTNGHLDIAKRAAEVFDEVVMAVYATPDNKRVLFNTEERIALINDSLGDYSNIKAVGYTGLTVDYAREISAKVMIRGLREGVRAGADEQKAGSGHRAGNVHEQPGAPVS